MGPIRRATPGTRSSPRGDLDRLEARATAQLHQEIGKVHQEIGKVHQEIARSQRLLVFAMVSTATATTGLVRSVLLAG